MSTVEPHFKQQGSRKSEGRKIKVWIQKISQIVKNGFKWGMVTIPSNSETQTDFSPAQFRDQDGGQ